MLAQRPGCTELFHSESRPIPPLFMQRLRGHTKEGRQREGRVYLVHGGSVLKILRLVFRISLAQFRVSVASSCRCGCCRCTWAVQSGSYRLPVTAVSGEPVAIFFLSLLSAVNLLSSCYLAPIHVLSASFPPPVRLLRILPPLPFQTKTLSFWKFLKPVILNFYLNFKQFERSFFLNVEKI